MSLKYEEAIKDYQDEKYEKVILLSKEYQEKRSFKYIYFYDQSVCCKNIS